MKNFILVIFLILISCKNESKVEAEIKEIPVTLAVSRFDQAFFDAKPTDLPKLKKEFPAFFPKDTEDKYWIDKMTDPLWRELYDEVQKKYKDFSKQTKEIGNLIQHIKYYFPKTQNPKIVTLIYEMDNSTKAIYADSIVLIPLELYLGKDHKFYEFPKYQKQTLTESQILPDIVNSFAESKIPFAKNRNLITEMVDAGKALYLKDVLLPNYSDADKIGYTEEQIKFCVENEQNIWATFIEQKVLFSNDSRLANRFINPAPFSTFYLEIDNETPGRIGTWVGWQIVRSYMNNNKTSVQDMLKLDATTLFNQSKYKPNK